VYRYSKRCGVARLSVWQACGHGERCVAVATRRGDQQHPTWCSNTRLGAVQTALKMHSRRGRILVAACWSSREKRRDVILAQRTGQDDVSYPYAIIIRLACTCEKGPRCPPGVYTPCQSLLAVSGGQLLTVSGGQLLTVSGGQLLTVSGGQAACGGRGCSGCSGQREALELQRLEARMGVAMRCAALE
jgi:hypothetical protein